MIRDQQNWIALGCSVVVLLCFLFLPFYRVVVVGINGLMLLQYGYGVMYLPLLGAILMGFASVVIKPYVSVWIGAASFLVYFLLLLLGRDVLLGGNALASMAAGALNTGIGANVATLIPVSAGVGCIVNLVLIAGFVAAELLLNSPKRSKPIVTDDPLEDPFF